MSEIKVGDIVVVSSSGLKGCFSGTGEVTATIAAGLFGLFCEVRPIVSRGGWMNACWFEATRLSLAPPVSAPTEILPVDSKARKDIPLVTGVLDYFSGALAEVARVSKAGNDKHNPGQPLHWARGKSTDQADAIGRHLLERGGIDPDTGMRYSAQLAWRALALLQIELEEAGESPVARGAKEVSQ